MKRFFYYFGWTAGIGVIIFLGTAFQIRLEEEASRSFNLLPVLLFSALFPVFIGGLLRLPRLVMDIRENKPWTFDWVKFIAVGLPALYILILSIFPHVILTDVIARIIMLGNPLIQNVAGIVLGYVLLDCLKK